MTVVRREEILGSLQENEENVLENLTPESRLSRGIWMIIIMGVYAPGIERKVVGFL